MTDEVPRLAENVRRGERAKALLDDPLFVEAVEKLKDRAYRAMLGADPFDDKELRSARLSFDALNKLLTEFRQMVTTGNLDRPILEERRRRKPPAR